ncbi:MAG TPA: ATP-binding protein [Streptosporangiaceae bacterium]
MMLPFTYTTDLSQVRRLAEARAREAGLTDARVVDFVLAVSEVAANTIRHAQSPGSMEIWFDGEEIVCEMRDDGIITDPRVGRHTPSPDATNGHGLWLVHQVCDLVELHSDENGTIVRLHMDIPAREPGLS